MVNATAMGPLNPHDPYWGRFEGGGNSFGGIDGVRPGESTRGIYANLAMARELAIKNFRAQTFGGGVDKKGRSLQPVDMLETNATAKFGVAQGLVLGNMANVARYGAQPHDLNVNGAYARTIQLVNSFSYEPRNAYTFGAVYTPSYF